ncbi:hypothetical protein QFZ91_003815 [Paraburkholderia sp. JPY419]
MSSLVSTESSGSHMFLGGKDKAHILAEFFDDHVRM